MAKLILCGKVYRDVEKVGENGAKFSIGERGYNSKEKKAEMQFFNVFCTGKTAETALAYVKVGSWIYADCNLKPTVIEKEGKKTHTYNIYVNSMQFVGNKEGVGEAQGEQFDGVGNNLPGMTPDEVSKMVSDRMGSFTDDDIPF